jgi:hypothetical protein
MRQIAEGKALAEAKADQILALPWQKQHEYEKSVETVQGAGSTRYRITSVASWDMEPWKSDMYIWVTVRPSRGLRRLWPHRATRVRGGETLPKEPTRRS